jgi:hypothetical protein
MTADLGYGLATFRSHALHMSVKGPRGGWVYPGYTVDCLDEHYMPCACGAQYMVNDVYHYHALDGVCHNKVKCV